MDQTTTQILDCFLPVRHPPALRRGGGGGGLAGGPAEAAGLPCETDDSHNLRCPLPATPGL